MDLERPLRDAEFLVVDAETNGRAGDACELTELGAVLVGGGELHDRWGTLVAAQAPPSRAVERLTGITSEMLRGAPAPRAALAELDRHLRGRVLVAHNAAFDRRVLRAAYRREGLDWPDPPVLCTLALARRLHPLASRRALRPLAESLAIDVDVAHRALADAETCARVFCALFKRLCAAAPTIRDAVELLGARRRTRPRSGAAAGARSRVRRRLPDLRHVGTGPGVYVIRDSEGRVLYVGKSVDVRARVRAHFAPSSVEGDWTLHAETVDHEPTCSELGALLLESRLIKRLRPPGNVRLKHADGYVYLRCRLDIAFPVLEVAPEPAAGRAVNVGPLPGRASAVELAEQLTSLFELRRCGRRLPRREWASAYGQMGRCLSPCLGDLDPNLYRRRVDAALGVLASDDAARRLLDRVDDEVAAAAASLEFERAAWLRHRRDRLTQLLDRLGPHVTAMHAAPRLVLAEHPRGASFDAFWIVGGRIADWGPLGDLDDLERRTRAALRHGDGTGATPCLAPEEIDDARILATWLAAHEAPALALRADIGRAELVRFLAAAAAGGPAAGPAVVAAS